MNPVLADLIYLLKLERIENDIFRGESRDIGSAQVFGGQVLGQALTAASYTVEGRTVHSLHAYFLRRGDVNAPIVYQVDRARDGRSFSNRRVVAVQHGRPILNMAASFQVGETGIEHQAAMPNVPGPEGLKDVTDIPEEVDLAVIIVPAEIVSTIFEEAGRMQVKGAVVITAGFWIAHRKLVQFSVSNPAHCATAD